MSINTIVPKKPIKNPIILFKVNFSSGTKKCASGKITKGTKVIKTPANIEETDICAHDNNKNGNTLLKTATPSEKKIIFFEKNFPLLIFFLSQKSVKEEMTKAPINILIKATLRGEKDFNDASTLTKARPHIMPNSIKNIQFKFVVFKNEPITITTINI